MTGEILRLKPEEVARLFAEGKMEVVADYMIERAKELLGKDFLGVEAIRNMESKFEWVGVNVEFAIDNIPVFPYDEQDLKLAKSNGEMVVLRPAGMLSGGRHVGVTVVKLRDLFQKDPLGKSDPPIFFRDWFDKEDFATKPEELKLGWTIVKKEVLGGSTDIGWHDRDQLLRQYEAGLKGKSAKNVSVRRRTATEAVYDIMLYYVNTGDKLLLNMWDLTSSQTSIGNVVSVGGYYKHGLLVSIGSPRISIQSGGVCPSR